MNIVNKRKWYFIIVAIVSIACIASLAIQGLNRGVDFQSGTQLTISFDQPVTKSQLQSRTRHSGFQ